MELQRDDTVFIDAVKFVCRLPREEDHERSSPGRSPQYGAPDSFEKNKDDQERFEARQKGGDCRLLGLLNDNAERGLRLLSDSRSNEYPLLAIDS